jgi:hypothetical protein
MRGECGIESPSHTTSLVRIADHNAIECLSRHPSMVFDRLIAT